MNTERESFDIPLLEIKKACCEAFLVTEVDFDNHKLSTNICHPRQAYWLIVKKTKPVTLQAIGEPFDRDKQAVLNGINSFKKRLRKDKLTLETFLGIGKKINASKLINEIAQEVLNG